MANEVAIRLAVNGGAEARAEFDGLKTSGTTAFVAVGDASDKATQRLSNSLSRAEKDAEAAVKRVAEAQAKIAAVTPQSPVQRTIDATVSSVSGTSARDSAAAFKDLLAAQDAYAARAEKIRALIDPLWAAQHRFDQELREARVLMEAGALSAEEFAVRERQLQASLEGVAPSLENVHGAQTRMGASGMIMQHVVRSTADSFVAGLPPAMIFGEQIGRVGEAAALSGGALGKFGAIMAGPWGLPISAGVALLSVIIPKIYEMATASDEAGKKTLSQADAAKALNNAIDDLTKATSASIRTTRQATDAAFIDAANMRNQEVQARNLTLAKIDLAKAAMAANRAQSARFAGEGGGGATGAAGGSALLAAGDQAEIARLDAFAKLQATKITAAQQNVNRLKAPILQRFAAEATDDTAAATGRYERTLGALNKQLTAGKISEQDYTAAVVEATRARDAATEKNGGRTKADHSAAEAARDAAKAQRELMASLVSIQGQFDPGATAARSYAEQLANIGKLSAAHLINDDTAQQYRTQALRAWWDAEAAAEADAQKRMLANLAVGQSGSEPIKTQDYMAIAVREATARDKFAAGLSADAIAQQKRDITSLAGFYKSAFEGGTGSIWTKFKSAGEDVIAQLLAKWTISKIGSLGGGGGLFGGILSSIIGHNAAGTPYWSGGATWVGENGPEIVNLPGGSRVTPASASRQMMAANENAAPPTLHFDLRGAVVTQDLLNQMNALANAAAQQGASAGASYAQDLFRQAARPGL